MNISLQSASYAALASFIACGLIVVTRKLHQRFTLDGEHGVQKFHTHPTPRIGGLGLMFGLVMGWCVQEDSELLVKADHLLGLILLASMPAFLWGLAEDLTKRVSARSRLLATMVSGLLGYWLTGYCINHLDINGVDAFFAWAPICIAFTAFAVAGVANAYNIIDGFNGLTGAAMIVAMATMGFIAYDVADTELVYFSLIFIGAIVGFMVWNYPLGRIFLGDGGAYAMGFLIAWMAVMLPFRNPEVSPWACLMACGYPVMETIYSMIRRKMFRRSSGSADAEHLHSLLKRVIIARRYQHLRAVIRNSMVMISLLPFFFVVSATGAFFYRDTGSLVVAFLVFFGIYVVSHRALFRSNLAHGPIDSMISGSIIRVRYDK